MAEELGEVHAYDLSVWRKNLRKYTYTTCLYGGRTWGSTRIRPVCMAEKLGEVHAYDLSVWRKNWGKYTHTTCLYGVRTWGSTRIRPVCMAEELGEVHVYDLSVWRKNLGKYTRVRPVYGSRFVEVQISTCHIQKLVAGFSFLVNFVFRQILKVKCAGA
jgi:hypothetical protein